MNGDDVGRIVNEVVALQAMLAEREHQSDIFRQELRENFRGVTKAITEHAVEDTRRFERVDTSLDHKIGGLYAYLEKQAAQQRTRAWQVAGVVVTAALGVIGIVISASRSGFL